MGVDGARSSQIKSNQMCKLVHGTFPDAGTTGLAVRELGRDGVRRGGSARQGQCAERAVGLPLQKQPSRHRGGFLYALRTRGHNERDHRGRSVAVYLLVLGGGDVGERECNFHVVRRAPSKS